MSGSFLLDWASLTVSLFNTILLLWLGLTVLLNAERRTWGIWLAGGGLLLGGAFFVSHTAILRMEFTHLSRSLRFGWYLGLMPVVVLPLGWYVVFGISLGMLGVLVVSGAVVSFPAPHAVGVQVAAVEEVEVLDAVLLAPRQERLEAVVLALQSVLGEVILAGLQVEVDGFLG